MNTTSYTAADTFPIKLIKADVMNGNKIIPYHIQINPTNVCNLNCPFCSCANRSKTDSIDYPGLVRIMEDFYELGCRAVTITGGGEPCLYPQINELIELCNTLHIKVGLTTNGTMLHKIKSETYKYITWCRISSGDDRKWTLEYEEELYKAVTMGSNVDWAFSHVITSEPNYDTILPMVLFANDNRFTHVRIVSDLLNLDNVDMEEVKSHIDHDELVIYQGRKEYRVGDKECLISLLKPLVGANGKLYPCCGSQYAEESPSLDYGDKTVMGHTNDINDIWHNQLHYDGSNCVKCYYDNYNDLLGIMSKDIQHGDFL